MREHFTQVIEDLVKASKQQAKINRGLVDTCKLLTERLKTLEKQVASHNTFHGEQVYGSNTDKVSSIGEGQVGDSLCISTELDQAATDLLQFGLLRKEGEGSGSEGVPDKAPTSS